MKLKLYRSATVGLFDESFKLLSDPWLTDGEYYGAWHHYPKYDLKKNINEINSYDAIYISHIHPDHSSAETLLKIDRKIPIYILKYHSPFLKFKLEKLGFKIFEVNSGETINLNKNFKLTIFAADNCNPKLCFKFLGCGNPASKSKETQQIDSISVVQNNKYTIVNVNDCPYDLSKHLLKTLKSRYNNIDILMTGYSGAGPYPQCLENLDLKEKRKEANKKKEFFLKQAANYLSDLRPNFYLPFAGTYTLGSTLSKYQNLRGVPIIDEAYDYLQNYLEKKINIKNEIKPIKINPDSTFDLVKKKPNKKFKRFDFKKFNEYLKKELKIKKLDYEKNETVKFDEIFKLSKIAFDRYKKKIKELNINHNTDILLDVENFYILISDKNDELIKIEKNKFKKPKKYVIYKVDKRLLKQILKGPRFAHWNNAEIGSHIKFFREPNMYDRSVYYGMNFFHT